MPRSLVTLGSNLGPRARTLERAVELLRAQAGISNLVASRWHETPSIGGPAGQGAFLNGAVAFDTSLSAAELHAKLQNIEDQLGRERKRAGMSGRSTSTCCCMATRSSIHPS